MKKETLKKIGSIIEKVLSGIGLFFAAIYAVMTMKDKDKYNINSEIKENELKKKDAADIITNSPNQDDVQQSIESEQQDFRKRVRDRLNKNI